MKFKLSTLLLIVVGLFSQQSYGQSDFSDDIMEKIETAKDKLESSSLSINKEKRAYAERLTSAEREVAQLREAAASIQREADEKLLSLQNLQERLKRWQDQEDYQRHLLQRYVSLVSENYLVSPKGDDTGSAIIDWSLSYLDSATSPSWEETEIAVSSGEFIHAQAIRVGPASWFVSSEGDTSGLYEVSPSRHLASYYTFDSDAHEELRQLISSGAGAPVFDPTQGRAIEIARNKETLVQHVKKGGLWIIPILFSGALALGIAIVKSIQLGRLSHPSQATLDKVETALTTNTPQSLGWAQNVFKSDNPPYQRIVDIIASQPPSQGRDDSLFSHLAESRRQVEKYLGVIALTAAIAPLLGLLGTVSGMIKTFKMLTIFGSGDPAAVSGGISEALVTTELGLIVAIPALVVSALLSRKTKSYMHHLENTAIALNNHSSERAGGVTT